MYSQFSLAVCGWQVPPQPHEGEIRTDSPSSEIQRLQEQNAGLRNAVSQMRKEMEMLSGHLPSAQSEEHSNANPEPKAGEDSAPPGEQGEMEAKRSKWWGHGYRTGQGECP